MAEKKSFVLYFDAYPCVRALPTDQRGYLFSAIFEYAIQEAQSPGTEQQILEQFPELSEAARMVFYFASRTIQRDTVKWREKHERYTRAAENRWKQRGQESEEAPSAARRGMARSDSAWSYVDA